MTLLRGGTRMRRAVAILLVLAAPAWSACTMRLYEVKQGTEKKGGIPFFVKHAGCVQETVRLDVVYTLTLDRHIESSGTIVTSQATVRAETFATKEFTNDLNALRKTLAGHPAADLDAILAAFGKLVERGGGDFRTRPEEIAKLPVAANHASIRTFVDYSKPYYLNIKRPLVGSADATATLGEEGTLSSAQASVEDKTLETVLSVLPVKEVLQAYAAPGGEARKLMGIAEETSPLVTLRIEQRVMQHIWTLATEQKTSLPDCITGAALPRADATGASYRRELVSDPAPAPPEDAPKPNTISLTGEIVLPKPQ